MCKTRPVFDETSCCEPRGVHSEDTEQRCYRIGIPVLTGAVWRHRGCMRWSIFLHTHTHNTFFPLRTVNQRMQLPKHLITHNSLSCKCVSKLSGCAVKHPDWRWGKLISQQPSVQSALQEGGQDLGGQKKKLQQLIRQRGPRCSAAGWGGGGDGKVRHLVSESFD